MLYIRVDIGVVIPDVNWSKRPIVILASRSGCFESKGLNGLIVNKGCNESCNNNNNNIWVVVG